MKSSLLIFLLLFFNGKIISQVELEQARALRIFQLCEEYRLEVSKKDNTINILNSELDSLKSTYQWLIKHAFTTLSFDRNWSSYPTLAILKKNEIKVFTSPKVYYSDSETIAAIHELNNIRDVKDMKTKKLVKYNQNLDSYFKSENHPLYSKLFMSEETDTLDIKGKLIDKFQTQINIGINNFYFTNDYSISQNEQLFKIINSSANCDNVDSFQLSSFKDEYSYLYYFILYPYVSKKEGALLTNFTLLKIVFQEDFKYALVYYQLNRENGFLVYDLKNHKLRYNFKVFKE